jgi:RHS repeat-associated protein
VNLPTAADLVGVTAVPRISRSNQISLTGAIGAGIGSIGGSVASGDTTGQLDYLDMNGDGFPDVVGADGIQYTDPTGALGSTHSAMPDGNVRSTSTTTGNASAGSAARSIATGRGYVTPPASATANTSDSGNDMPPLGVGGNLGSGSSSGSYDLLDVNGDGLSDRVYTDGRVALNLGYQFAAPESWPGAGPINDGTTTNSGLNIGFNTDFYGLAGGASFSDSVSSAKDSLVDVNGDGLADRVLDTNPMQVALNTGSGFAPAQPFLGSLPGINADVNAKLGGGAYVEFGVCFAVIAGCIVINPGADVSTGSSRTEQVLRDINGDGFVDQLRSANDGQLVVAENRTGRTNLLRSVSRPLGSRIDLDYTRDGNTFDQPASRYVLSRVAVDDGHPGDGQDVALTTFRYSGGHYDRLEREFLGYHTVVEEQRDAADDTVLRGVTRDYLNDSYYTQGQVARELVTDGDGHPFQETLDSFLLRDVLSPSTPADPRSTTATIFPQLVRTDKRVYEGQPTPGKATFTEMSYDDVGNLVRSFDAGDPGVADDVETLTRYTASDPACQATGVVGVATTIDVRSNGTVLRHRESAIDCVTGNVTQQRSMLADGTSAVTDLGYFPNGTLRSVTSPPNEKGQRYRLDYEYDPVIASHITATTDSFGLRSTSTYNLEFGQPETTNDVNNQQIRYTYDSVGRVGTVTGPYEIADNHTTITFEYHPDADVPYAVSRHIDRNADGSVKPTTIDTITFVDGLKRVIQTKKTATVSTGPTTAPADVMTVSGHLTFDALGHTVAQSYPVTEPLGPGNTTFDPAIDPVAPTRTSYDVLDRTTKVVLPDNTRTTTSYGFGPDRSGATQLESTVTDAKGNVRRTYTDIRQLTTAVRTANPAAGQPVVWTSYGYDPLNQLTSVTDDHDNVTSTTYDNFGRETVVDSPDSGRTETDYDLADNPIRKVTANLTRSQRTQQGVTTAADQTRAIRYVYDFNRLTEIHYPVFERNDVTYTYGRPGAPNNGAGRIVRQADAAGTLDREYGPLGEVTKETRAIPGLLNQVLRYTTSYRFDTWNRVRQMTYPDGEVLSYHYDSGGLVDGATGVKGDYTYPYLTSLQYDKFDQRALQVTGNGVTTRYSYNADNRRLATLQATQSDGQQFQNVNYGYDSLGNVTSVANNVPNSGPLTIGGPSTQTFGYDDQNRLTSAQGDFHPDQHDTNHYDLTMAYDSIDNVTAKTQHNEVDTGPLRLVQAPTTYRYDYSYNGPGPHAASDIGPLDMRYDADGNLINQIDHQIVPLRRQMVWDEENRLACVRDAGALDPTIPQAPSSCGTLVNPIGPRFVYDDKGNRIVKDGGPGDLTIYPNQGFTQHNLTAVKYIFVGDTRLVSKQVEPSRVFEGNQFYYHPDQLGSTSYGTNVNGRVVEHQEFFPSGETWADEGGSDPAFQFTGKELDQETGLYYYGARYYNPKTANWQSADPAVHDYLTGTGNQGVYNPANLATYSYAYDNPVKLTDPDGRMAALALGAPAAAGCFASLVCGGIVIVGGALVIGGAWYLGTRSTTPTASPPQVQDNTDVAANDGSASLRVTDQQYKTWKQAAAAAVDANAKADTRDLPVLLVDFNYMPEIAVHTAIAQQQLPWTRVLNRAVDPLQEAANRAVACGRGSPVSCDEYPFASTMQGGASGLPYSTATVDLSEQFKQGALIRNFYSSNDVCRGCAFAVQPINVPPANDPRVLAIIAKTQPTVHTGWAGP